MLSMTNGYNFITANETDRDLAIKSGIDNSHNVVTGSGAGGSYISLSETGGIKLSINGEAEGAPAADTDYLELTSSICKLTGVDLELTSTNLFLGAYTNNDYITFDGIDTFEFYANNTIASSIVEAGAFNTVSSIKYKKNVYDFNESALDLITDVNIVHYNFKNQSLPKVGFIAEYTHPYFSTPNMDSFDLTNTISILIKAVQELSIKIKRMENNYAYN
jgi:hypothetical protein